MSTVVGKMKIASKQNQIVVWVKPLTNDCYMDRTPTTEPPLCRCHDDPDVTWGNTNDTLLYIIFYHAAAFGAVLHVISTSLLGITAITMANTIAGEETVHKLASLLLVVLGGSYILLFVSGKGGHSHSHNQPMEKMAVAGLVLVPALSPCATTLPVFLAVGNSSSMMVLAIIVLLFSTITVMTSLVALSFYGASQLKFHWVERYDKLLVGSVLCLVGILTLVFHDHDHDHGLGASTGEHLNRKLIAF
ncbi:uncharacterized protein LOC116120485 [Pistacia vera]|uniref:uncharacterized protein LOC116120485 n=1 Tax=Pistacia vera TaxID=55513 RepID=UPI0012631F8A|nr:uncharacterized protein LOC116120485 [Pistacia vera]